MIDVRRGENRRPAYRPYLHKRELARITRERREILRVCGLRELVHMDGTPLSSRNEACTELLPMHPGPR